MWGRSKSGLILCKISTCSSLCIFGSIWILKLEALERLSLDGWVLWSFHLCLVSETGTQSPHLEAELGFCSCLL